MQGRQKTSTKRNSDHESYSEEEEMTTCFCEGCHKMIIINSKARNTDGMIIFHDQECLDNYVNWKMRHTLVLHGCMRQHVDEELPERFTE